jgi:hypothetical protein
LLDPSRQRQRRRQAESAGELGGGQPAWELHERERISTCLGDDPFEDGLVQPSREDGLQQRPRISPAQRIDADLGKAGQATADLTRRERQHDSVRKQAVSDEREGSGGCAVEPLRVVDQAEERLLLGSLGEQAENRESDENGLGACPVLSPNATSSASRCGSGRRSINWRSGEQSCCSAA